MPLSDVYYSYSDFLKKLYGERVYKLPISLPLTCPNRDGTKGVGGCIFCGAEGANLDSLPASMSIADQLNTNMAYMGSRYKAKKFIAYFQNYTTTYMPLEQFRNYMSQAIVDNVVEISIATRPDCIDGGYMEILQEISEQAKINITIELGLQSSNNQTLKQLNRGHSLEDYIHAANLVKKHNFYLCTHLILDLPFDEIDDIINDAKIVNQSGCDLVKLHSLFIVKNTVLERMYSQGQIKLVDYNDYVERVICFLENMSPEISIARLVGRAPYEAVVYLNHGKSWWRIKEDIEERMRCRGTFQGKHYIILNQA